MLIQWVARDSRRWAQGRIGPVPTGKETEEAGSAYAERVAVRYNGNMTVDEALGDGPEWKEIVLG